MTFKRPNGPRAIRYEAVQIGDVIEVVTRQQNGLTVTKRGRVHVKTPPNRQIIALYTKEGGLIANWSRDHPPTTVRLIEAAPAPQATLF